MDKHIPNPSLPKQRGARQSPLERVKNFDQVAAGLSAEEAALESNRCLNCKNAPCSAACPVNIKIPEFIACLRVGDAGAAASKIMESSLLPAVCGRVCPQENHCEGACVLKEKFGPVSIGLLERYAADTARAAGALKPPQIAPESGFSVAVIGSGPASLTAAAELRRAGHKVTVYEALHKFGGVLSYGIPPFRLPREVIASEVETVRRMGVEFVADALIGGALTIAELRQRFDAVFVGSGAGLPTMPGIPGENLAGVMSANEFLTRLNLMGAYKPGADTPVDAGEHVVVLGGGNSAMDAARCALRLGPKSVTLAYRRSRLEMPARAEEAENAEEEGVRFEFLAAPLEFIGDEKGRLRRIRFTRMELGAPDGSGRSRPQPVAGSEFDMEADTAIIAIGQKPNPIIKRTTPELQTGRSGAIAVDEAGQTSVPGVFAGGDISRGGATALLAMKDGKRAAAAINKYLSGGKR
ncbi:MAG: NADPH-dependent glutamate synthase [Elusimicrobiales bacterium]